METRDIIARPITALDDAESYGVRARARLSEGDLDGADRALQQMETKLRGAASIIELRRARLA